MHYKPSRGQYDSAQQSYKKLIIKLIKYFPSTVNACWISHASNAIANANKRNSDDFIVCIKNHVFSVYQYTRMQLCT